ncbi:MAG: hypothetical protein GY913_35060 [Proteobacteria bacterium]|nr:hypothetical protein [Pseudomonadota bacterium]MCP4922150.1 hypothetical protein [Pseudomonadota bacterium]
MNENAPLLRTEDEVALAESAREVVESVCPRSASRALIEGYEPGRELWAQAAELGWTSILLSGDDGGLEMGLPAVCAVMEELGRTLAPSPMLSVVLAGHAAPERTLEGEVIAVVEPVTLDAQMASAFLCAGRLYERDEVDIRPLRRLDGRDAAVVVPTGEGTPCAAEPDRDGATVALCAEMLGGMTAALDLTLEYLKTRRQFDKPIGAFQTLQHRAVDLFIEVQLARGAVMNAALHPTPANVSLAKARCNDAFLAVCHEGIQLHGGIGMTAEHDLGLFVKRARVCEHTLGHSAFHRDRWAVSRGY